MKIPRTHPFCLLLPFAFCLLSSPLHSADFATDWEKSNDRIWIGPDFWANPLQDWRIANGRAECHVSGGNRNLFLLTRETSADDKAPLKISVRLGRLDHSQPEAKHTGHGGFRLGIKGSLPDYRNAAIHGGKRGLNAGITTEGHLFVGNQHAKKIALPLDRGVDLSLTAVPAGNNYRVTLEGAVVDSDRKTSLATEIPAHQLAGHIALVSHFASTAPALRSPKGEEQGATPQPKPNQKPKSRATRSEAKGKSGSSVTLADGTNRAGNVRFWFSNLKISGPKITTHPERAFGPVLWTQHTLHQQTLKLTAFLPPVGPKDPQTVRLETLEGGTWQSVGEENIHPLARTATFRVDNWNDKKDTPYRVVYNFNGKDHHYTGTIRKDPVDKDPLVVAGFTGNTDYLFPNARIAKNVATQNPDLLFFSGDQLYENVAGYGFVREPVETAALDYLRKYWLFGWAFGDLMRDRPTVIIPDDHDVYQGNIWGHHGRKATLPGFADGGFNMDPEWVNMVNRTQTAHLPDPYDPTPLLRGISVYYTGMTYGRVSFAVIEDRKFKTGPASVLPNERGRPDHVLPDEVPEGWDPLSLDVPEARLLGERQLKFLRDWSANWTGADFKCALSQTIFCNLANYHGDKKQYLVADLDSNGWPQTGRNKALHELRRGFAFMFAGDQHLASIVHHGVTRHNDAGYSFCVPSIAAGYPRSWLPDVEGRPVANRPEPGLPNTGEYREGLGNRVTVHAIGNPAETNRKDTLETFGHDKASGHGIVRFNKKDRTITMECYRLVFDAKNPVPEDQFLGWPKTITLEDNYGRTAIAHLPTLNISGINNPVIQVIDETFGDIVYTLRINGDRFRPRIFDNNASYTIIVGEPSTSKTKTLKNLRPAKNDKEVLEITL